MRFTKLLIYALLPFAFQSFSQNQIEIVESIPLETNLDNPDIRNTQEVWLEMINGARSTLDIEQFYISNEKGEALDTIINAIVAAGARGVKVRIIVDAGMYKTYPETVDWLEKQKNIVVMKYDVKSLTGGIQHAKFFIVDGEQVFLGSQNFDWRALSHIHEIGVRINANYCIALYKSIFQYDWCMSNKSETYCFFNLPAFDLCRFTNASIDVYNSFSPKYILPNFINDTIRLKFPSESFDEYHIIKLLTFAKSEITLQFLSYSSKDWGAMDSALTNAANRGVKIKMIISDWNLSKDAVETFLGLQENPNIEIRYTEIPEWSGGYIPFARVEHCKFITADGKQCWIGTSNMSKSYFYNSRNVGVVVTNDKFSTRLRDIFYKSWDGPYTNKIEPGGNYQIRFHKEKD